MSNFLENQGLGRHSRVLLRGEYSTIWELPPEVASWRNHMKLTPKEKTLPPVLGAISKEEFQETFRAPDEQTSSNPNDLNYTIWKAMAQSEYL